MSVFDITDDELRLMAGEMTAQELRTVRAVLNGLKAQATEAGWQLVPKEPTREMILAGKHTLKGAADFTEGIRAECAYKAMLKAAPAQESEGEG